VLVDTFGSKQTLAMIEKAGLPVPKQLVDATRGGKKLFTHPTANVGKYFVAG
jgi:hypothetical protein